MATFHTAMLPTYFVTVLLLTACSLPCYHDFAIPEVTLRDDFVSDDVFLLLCRCLYLPTLATVMGSSADQSVSGGTGMGKHSDSPAACWEHGLLSPKESIQQL